MTHVLRCKQSVGTEAKISPLYLRQSVNQGCQHYSESTVHRDLQTQSEETVTTQIVEFPLRRDSISSVLTAVPPSNTCTTSGIGNDRTQAHIMSYHVR